MKFVNYICELQKYQCGYDDKANKKDAGELLF